MQIAVLGGVLVAKVGIYEAWQLPLTLLALPTAALITKYPIGVFAEFEYLVTRISNRPYLSAALIAAGATCARLALSPFLGVPEPVVPDEVSLIFQAKTYLAGHFANHVNLLPNFQPLLVNITPTYTSAYPVLRSFPIFIGLFLGIGAWGGVLLSMVALTVAVYWMVREWMNAGYAFIVAFIVIIRYGLFSLWVNAYWGGAFTALGGALLLGGFKAVRSRPNLFSGAAVGSGVVILMTTRPYEGLAYAAPFGAALIIQFIRSTSLERGLLLPAGVAAAIVVAAGVGLSVADNQVATGDWKVSPYSLYIQTQNLPVFLVQGLKPLEAQPRYAAERIALANDTKLYNRRETWAGILTAENFRFRNYWIFYIGFALLIPFVLGNYALRREPTVLLAGALLSVALSLGSFDSAHYAAPGFGFVILAIMEGFRSLRQWRPWGHAYGLSLSRILPLALILGSVMPLRVALTGSPSLIFGVDFTTSTPCCWLRPRSFHITVANELDRYEGKNLVIVSDGPNATNEFLVSNDPDIDNEKTIWANHDPEFNKLAIDRYQDRRAWRLGWLDGGAACLQLYQANSSLADALPDSARLSGGQKQGWVLGSPDRCPGGLIHAPFVQLK